MASASVVELAWWFAGEPWLVLLDEPAAGMTDEETARMSGSSARSTAPPP
jgi:ABC-type uncharacterized transport system ATPase subunit